MPFRKVIDFLETSALPTDYLLNKPKNKKPNIGWCSVFPPTRNGAAAVTYYHFQELRKDKRINLFAIPVNGRIDKRLFPAARLARLEDGFLDAVIFFCLGEKFEKNAKKTMAKKIAWQTMHFTPKERQSEMQLFAQLKTADVAIMTSETAAKTYRKNGLKETHYVPIGVKLGVFKKTMLGNKALFVGRAEYKKGIIPFLDCAAKVLAKNKKTIFELSAAEEKNCQFFRETAERITKMKKKFPKNFFFEKEWLDYERLPEKYRGAFVLVFPSNNEGFGVPLIEAMACGIPAIVFDRQPMNEIIANNKTGFCIGSSVDSQKKYHGHLFPDVQKMAKKIIELFNDKKLLSKLSENCIKRAKKYSIERVAKQLVDIALREIDS